MAHAVLRLATAQKYRLANWALLVESSDHADRREIPDFALDRHTARGKRMGRDMDHFVSEAAWLADYFGDLSALEEEYRQRFRQISENDPNLPDNPWPENQPALNPDPEDQAQTQAQSQET